MKSLRFIIVLSSIFSAKVDLFNLPWVTYLLKIVTYSLFFLHLKILFLHLHCTTTGVQYRWEGPSGPHRSVSEVSVREPRQRRCRRSEAEPHAPPGLSPQVTGGEQTGFLKEILNVSVTDFGHK